MSSGPRPTPARDTIDFATRLPLRVPGPRLDQEGPHRRGLHAALDVPGRRRLRGGLRGPAHPDGPRGAIRARCPSGRTWAGCSATACARWPSTSCTSCPWSSSPWPSPSWWPWPAAGLSGASGARGASEAFNALAAVGFMGLYALTAVLMLVLSLYVPAALARFVMLDRVSAAFEVRENLAFIRRNLGNYAMTLLLYLVASFAAQVGDHPLLRRFPPRRLLGRAASCAGPWARWSGGTRRCRRRGRVRRRERGRASGDRSSPRGTSRTFPSTASS